VCGLPELKARLRARTAGSGCGSGCSHEREVRGKRQAANDGAKLKGKVAELKGEARGRDGIACSERRPLGPLAGVMFFFQIFWFSCSSHRLCEAFVCDYFFRL